MANTPENQRINNLSKVIDFISNKTMWTNFFISLWKFMLEQLSLTIPPLVESLKTVFPPIGYILNGIGAIFDTVMLFYKRYFREPKELHELTPEEASTEIRERINPVIRTIGNIIILTFSVIAVIVAAGILATGVGIIAALVVTTIGWMTSSMQEWWHARQYYQQLKDSINDQLKMPNSPLEKEALLEQLRQGKAVYTSRRNDALLGLLAIVGVALMVAGAFAAPVLSVAGMGVIIGFFAIKLVIATVNKISNWVQSKKSESPDDGLEGDNNLTNGKTFKPTQNLTFTKQATSAARITANPQADLHPFFSQSTNGNKKASNPAQKPTDDESEKPHPSVK